MVSYTYGRNYTRWTLHGSWHSCAKQSHVIFWMRLQPVWLKDSETIYINSWEGLSIPVLPQLKLKKVGSAFLQYQKESAPLGEDYIFLEKIPCFPTNQKLHNFRFYFRMCNLAWHSFSIALYSRKNRLQSSQPSVTRKAIDNTFQESPIFSARIAFAKLGGWGRRGGGWGVVGGGWGWGWGVRLLSY